MGRKFPCEVVCDVTGFWRGLSRRDFARRQHFNGKLRDECLNGEIFYSLKEAQVVIEQWRVEYNTRRPHSALGYRPPVPAAYRVCVITAA